jgi:hypothetical protein
VSQNLQESSGTFYLAGTPTTDNLSYVNFSSITAQVQGGATAPNCQDELTVSSAGWSCSGGQGLWSGTVTNPNTLNTATLQTGSPVLIDEPINGAVVDGATTCTSGLTVSPGGSCSVKITQPNSGHATSLTVNPTTGYFGPTSFTTTSSPNCSQTVNLTAAVQTACSGPQGSKTLRFTLTNPNTLHDYPIASIGATLASVQNDTCGNLVAAGSSCTFDLRWDHTPESATNAAVTITTTSGGPFQAVQLFNSGADYDISCP